MDNQKFFKVKVSRAVVDYVIVKASDEIQTEDQAAEFVINQYAADERFAYAICNMLDNWGTANVTCEGVGEPTDEDYDLCLICKENGDMIFKEDMDNGEVQCAD